MATETLCLLITPAQRNVHANALELQLLYTTTVVVRFHSKVWNLSTA